MFRGDMIVFTLTLPGPGKGRAFLRTNIGRGAITREETRRQIHFVEPPLGRDWFDIPMQPAGKGRFQITLPLLEIGHFEAKAFFSPEKSHTPVWAPGPNTTVNVEPAHTCCANIIYNAFVRQFGPNKSGTFEDAAREQNIQSLDKDGYTVIPPSGTFRDLIAELDFIIGRLGCRFIQLLPIHPTPTTYGRLGRFGSPYAALSFTAVDPALAQFDTKTTPLEQFAELVDAVHARQAKILIDIVINHTGWAADLHETHPQWLVRDPQGRIENPGAWGVRWEDLTKLDYAHKDMWPYMADVFLTWCRRGVDGFRCDAGYMIPVEAWKYIIATVREQFADTIFFLEGLGGKISTTRELLNTANFNWAYSELFQNYDRSQIENYLPEAIDIADTDGIMVHFAETHDNQRLAARSQTYARMRTALCALCARQGAFGFANGVEWYATAKLNVHASPSLNWGAQDNQVQAIERLSILLKQHPAFHDQSDIRMIQRGEGNVVVVLRHHRPSGKQLLIAANLDDSQAAIAQWAPADTQIKGRRFWDLLTDNEIEVTLAKELNTIELAPGLVYCLSPDLSDLKTHPQNNRQAGALPVRIRRQCLRAKALEVHTFHHGVQDMGDFDSEQAALELAQDPIEFCRKFNLHSRETRVITWQWPADANREVMIPPHHFLLVRAAHPFRALWVDDDRVRGSEESICDKSGTWFALFMPPKPPSDLTAQILKLAIYIPGSCERVEAPLLLLTDASNVRIKTTFQRQELLQQPLSFLAANQRGGMLRAAVRWGELTSRYDAFLAANLNAHYPVDRWIFFTRCRAWVVFQDYSQKISTDCMLNFRIDKQFRGNWRFQIPTGMGKHVVLTIALEMQAGQNKIHMTIGRLSANNRQGRLADQLPVRVILRPDIESRSFHDTTKAYLGPEHHFAKAITDCANGFCFTPDDQRALQVQTDQGSFVHEPEWYYMVHRPLEAQRGLDPDSDLFSPGYFTVPLKGGQKTILTARGFNPQSDPEPDAESNSKPAKESTAANGNSVLQPPKSLSVVENMLEAAMMRFVIKRGELKSVVAGYPWFLDWGRDALIFTRGLIASGKADFARAILKQFGQFEQNGTLPNMIQGENAANRDTSDAPLWFFTACNDLLQAEGKHSFLNEYCGERPVLQILRSMGHAFINGTPNQIRMDPQTGLIFSPAHFTWMDTNHPAGTPRQGYPIEIQALWFAALSFLTAVDTKAAAKTWRPLQEKVQASIVELFWLPDEGYLSDCLHADYGVPARQALADDALRPNQLLAVTLGAIKQPNLRRQIVTACQALLVPGAIRSLADKPVRHPVAIELNGKSLNDPHNPYQGRYQGDEDTQRKPAYHNGTAWTWFLPVFCEAWVKAYGSRSKATALAWLGSSANLLNCGCIGHIPEIVDGNFPHTQRGCDAQAWGVSELLRVWLKLKCEVPKVISA